MDIRKFKYYETTTSSVQRITIRKYIDFLVELVIHL